MARQTKKTACKGGWLSSVCWLDSQFLTHPLHHWLCLLVSLGLVVAVDDEAALLDSAMVKDKVTRAKSLVVGETALLLVCVVDELALAMALAV